MKGLHLREYRTKSVYYLYYRTTGGIQRRLKIGDAAQIALKDARKVASDALLKVLLGQDPSLDRALERKALTVQEAFEACMKEYWSVAVKAEWKAEVNRLYARHIEKAFGSKKLSTIKVAALKTWFLKKHATPYEANRALRVFSRIFNFAIENELVESNPCSKIKQYQEAMRGRYATTQELEQLGILLSESKKKFPREVAFILALIYSGARPSSIEKISKGEIKSVRNEQGFARVRLDGKTGEDQVLIPEPLFVELSFREPITLGATRKLWEQLRRQVDCEDLRLRDLRRTFASIALSKGESLTAIGELLNHKCEQTTKIYAKLLDEDRIEVSKRSVKNVRQILGKEKSK